MSSQRVQKLFEAMPEQVRRLGGYSVDFREVLRWQGRVAAGALLGHDAAVIDFTSLAWVTGNLRAVLVAEPASDLNNTAAMKTQSHAAGVTIDGSVRFNMYLESSAALTNAESAFQRQLFHHLIGQLAAPVQLWYCANGTEPTVQGVNGAVVTAAFTSAGWYLPWGMTYPGGV